MPALALSRPQSDPQAQGDCLGTAEDIAQRYACAFSWLQRYDEGLLSLPAGRPGGEILSPEQARAGLAVLKTTLLARGEATDLFARERGGALAALLGNLEQEVFGQQVYPSAEEKAANLLYFAVKNHPFSDGNKRSGAFLFLEFLQRNGMLTNASGQPRINDLGLVALVLLVAQSRPDQKEEVVRLVAGMLAG